MPTYRVYMTAVVSTVKMIEADDEDQATEIAYDQGVPTLMFVDHTYPDEGQWDVDEVEPA